MFNNLFSSRGRIRRLEYCLSVVFYFIGFTILDEMLKGNKGAILGFLYIPLIWFVLAQGAKRCHDINNSGWCQIIPFYFLWMVLKEGTPGSNDYGMDPKASFTNQHLTTNLTVGGVVSNTVYPKTEQRYTAPIADVVRSLQQQKQATLQQQTVLDVINVNYGLTQDVLKQLRSLDKTNSLSYTLTGTTAAITINYNDTPQVLLDDLCQIIPNIDVREVKLGSISIKIK